MNRISIVAILVFSLSAHANDSTLRSQIAHCPPVSSTVQLTTGENIELPLCYDNADYVSAMGYGDLETINQALAPLKLYAVSVDGKALVTLAALNYGRSSLGSSYKEFIVGVLASPTPDLSWAIPRFLTFSDFLSPLGPPKNYATVVLKIWVDNEPALHVGNEIWGFNKSLAKITMSTANGFRVEDSDGNLIIAAQWPNKPPIPVPYGQYLHFYGVTAGGTWTNASYQGSSRLGEMSSIDSVTYGSTDWGKTLSGYQIEPSLRVTARSMSLQLGEPIAALKLPGLLTE